MTSVGGVARHPQSMLVYTPGHPAYARSVLSFRLVPPVVVLGITGRALRALPTLVMLAVLLALGIGTPAQADPPQPTRIYLDAQTLRFNAPLRGDAKREVEIFTILPGDSKAVELTYWRRPRGAECPLEGKEGSLDELITSGAAGLPEDPSLISRRAALRGTAEGDTGDYRFIAHLGPLRINVEYCFHLSWTRVAGLTDIEKDAVQAAVRDTMGAVAQWSRVYGQRPHRGACGHGEKSPTTLDPCELTAEFSKQLQGKEIGESRFQLDGRSATLSEAFARSLTPPRKKELAALLTQLVTANQQLPKYVELRGKIDGLGPSTYRYDPLDSLKPLTAGALAGALGALVKKTERDSRANRSRDPALSKQQAALAKTYEALAARYAALAAGDEPALANALWADRAILSQLALDPKALGKQALSGPAARALREYLTLTKDQSVQLRTAQPAAIEITEADRKALLDEVPPQAPITRSKAALASARAKALGGHPNIAALRELPGWTQGDDGELEGYIAKLGELEVHARGILEPKAKLQTIGDALANKLEKLEQLGPIGKFTWTPTFQERFPLYASADLGLAGALLPVRGGTPRGELVAYFGVNLYFTAIDKDEPLWPVRQDPPGRNFLRRFSMVAGFSVIRPQLNRDLSVKGILRNQVLLTGVGFRVLDYLRLGGGAMWYRQDSLNPLASADRTAARVAPYLSLSMDIDVIGTVRGWFDDASRYAAAP